MRDLNTKPLILLGAGGHAKVVAEALRLSGRKIAGVTDPYKPSGTHFCGAPLLTEEYFISNHPPGKVELVNGLGAIPGKHRRREVGRRMRQLGYRFASVIHPSAVIANDVELAEGAQIMAGAVIQPGVTVGVDTIVNTGVCIDHDCKIAANCHLAPGVVLSGGVIIGENVHLGTGSSVIQNIKVGSGSIVAAGSTLYKDIPRSVKYIQSRPERTVNIGE